MLPLFFIGYKTMELTSTDFAFLVYAFVFHAGVLGACAFISAIKRPF